MTVNVERLEELFAEFLLVIGEDPGRPGLAETPGRMARLWQEFVEYDPGRTDTTFEAVETDQMVVVSGMRVYSFCERHALPFWADVSIGYIARKRVLGLSKFARIAHQFAHRLQIQERLVGQIADEVQALTGSEDVAVLAHGKHLCMVMRGVSTDGTMTTSIMRGVFREDAQARAEFLRLCRG
jgi:GTP cyclohydrolase I